MNIKPNTITRIKLLLVPLLSVAALVIPLEALLILAAMNLWAIHRQPNAQRIHYQLFRVMLIQTLMIGLVYLLRFGFERLPDALELSLRMLVMILPGLWYFLSTPSHRTLNALRGVVSDRQALVLSTSLSLMPKLINETKQLYQLQRIRGAAIAPKDMWRFKAWKTLTQQVCLPALIRLIQLTQQQALALKARGFTDNPNQPISHYPSE
ncbi:energy-coupling factor transporter transmembrane component T [Ferrimonas aestuarii]|nr:energy-coupling factor transporter transmembrane component T [Ferrimonas aestuarii]